MLKKTLAAVGVAGLLVLGAASAANAESYNAPGEGINANALVIAPGASTGLNLHDVPDTVTSADFSVTGPGVVQGTTLASAATGTATVTKPVVDGTASATFKAPDVATRTEYTIAATTVGDVRYTIVITVDPVLAGTGGEVPAAAIWLGVGALGLGGIAVTAVAARRRATNQR